MTRLFYWLGVFVLGAVVAHLAFVLLMPGYEARALQQKLLRELGSNSFHTLHGAALRRLVRHPLPGAAYGVCALDLAPERGASLRGPDLRTLWALTVYSPRGDVIYAITDRHVPHGALNVRFEYRPDAAQGRVALPQLREGTLIVPLAVPRATLVMETYPWHPGQMKLVNDLLERMQCAPAPLTGAPAATSSQAGAEGGDTANATGGAGSTPRPRSRPMRASP